MLARYAGISTGRRGHMKRGKTGTTGPFEPKRAPAAAGAIGARDRMGTAEPPALAGLTGDVGEAASGAGGDARPAEASTVERPGDLDRQHAASTPPARPGRNRLSLGNSGHVQRHRRKSITEYRRFTCLQLVPHAPAKPDGHQQKAGPADGPARVREVPSPEGGRRLRLASGASMHVSQARSRAD
jgi:hypothetical protein